MNKVRVLKFGIVSLTVCLTSSFAAMCFSTPAMAGEIAGKGSKASTVNTLQQYAHLNDTVTPADIHDGVVNVIDPRAIQDLLVWARSSKTDLQDGLKQIDQLPRSQKHAALKNLIQSVIHLSGDTSTELLMRSVLRRAIQMDKFIDVAAPSPERETLGIELLKDSANWAIRLYPSDRNFLNEAAQDKKQNTIRVDLDFVDLGIQSGQYVLNHL